MATPVPCLHVSVLCQPHETITRNSSGDEIANVNFLCDVVVNVHALQPTIKFTLLMESTHVHSCQMRLLQLYTVRHKILHHFVFAITLSYLSLFEYLLVHIYRDKFGTNWHQNHQSHLKGVFILLCEMQHTYTCYDQCWFSHIGLNVITIVLNI